MRPRRSSRFLSSSELSYIILYYMNQIVLSLACRQEYIFHLQMMEAQIQNMDQAEKLSILKTI